MNQKNILFFFIAFILFTGYSFGQNKSVSKLDYYKEMKGTVILDILPDSKGNIWIASLGGLVKFDGYEFQWFHNDPADNRTIGGLLTYSLFEDSKGRIWIGSLDYIYCYIPQTKLFKTYSMDVNFPVDGQPIVSSIVDDGKGRIYFGIRSNYSQSGSNALLYFDEEEDMMKGFEKEAGQEIQDVYYLISDNKGNVTFFTSNGVFLIDPNGELTNIPRDVFNPVFQDNEYPNGMIVSDDGSLWFTSNRSNLYHMNGQNMESWSLEELYGESVTPNFPSPITFDADENILIGGSQGLITFNRQSSSFTIKKFDNEIVFNSSMIRVISYDLFGNLWMGSQSEGLYKVPNRNILKSYTHDPNDSTSISGGWISRIFEDSNGIISIPSNNQNGNEGLNRLDPNTGILTRTLYKDMMPDLHNIYMINEIRPGELFFVSDGKYFVYNIKTHSIDDPGLISNHKEMVYVNNVIRDSKGILWICTFKGLFREKEGKSKQFRFSDFSRSDNNSNDVTLILESMENGIWVLTNNGLFFIHNDTDLVERHGFDNSKGDVFSTQDINSLYEDKNGILWVGTWQGGLNRYDPELKKIKVYDLDDGLPSMSIQGILGDEKNNVLWLSTFAGMSRFSIEEEQFNNFSTEDGAQGRLYADGAYLKTSKGLFVFGGSNGINIFDPDDFTENSVPPKISITGFKEGNESLAFVDASDISTTEIKLVHDQNNISIDYLGIHYDNPSKNRFAYKLENFDSEWRNVGNQRSAYYYNLPPGNYTFNVKSANSYGIWNENYASINFSISPPWWMTWWAYTLYGLGLVLSVLYIDSLRKKKLKEIELEKTKEKELAHAKEIEKAYKNLKTTQSQLIHAEKMASLGGLTAGIAHEIQNPLNFVNNFSDVSIDLLEEMEEEIVNGNENEVKDITEDIKQNLKKISHHGQRASGIVRSMLMHSRGSNGKMESTDLNALIKEYVNLAFHGMRASKTAINVKIDLDLDDTLGKIELNPEDFSRVILNLCKNAFDAMRDKLLSEKNKDYIPHLKVSTKKKGKENVRIDFEDNGHGVSDEVKNKLFQPFFTTKKGTEGTGLGLSITHDIIKNHKGQINISSKENEFTRFEIQLPLTIKKTKHENTSS